MKERLKKARLQRGLTQKKTGELVGVTENSIYRYEAGTVQPSETALKMMAQVYNQPVEWFYEADTRKKPVPRRIAGSRIAEAASASYTDIRRIDGELVPVTLSSVNILGAISAGGLVEAWQEDLGQASVPGHVLRTAPNAFGLKIMGSSLIGDLIFDGDIVVVDPDAPFVDGKIYAVRSEEYNQTIAARKVYEVGRRSYKLVSSDGSVVEVRKSRTELLGRIRWSFSFREH